MSACVSVAVALVSPCSYYSFFPFFLYFLSLSEFPAPYAHLDPSHRPMHSISLRLVCIHVKKLCREILRRLLLAIFLMHSAFYPLFWWCSQLFYRSAYLSPTHIHDCFHCFFVFLSFFLNTFLLGEEQVCDLAALSRISFHLSAGDVTSLHVIYCLSYKLNGESILSIMDPGVSRILTSW